MRKFLQTSLNFAGIVLTLCTVISFLDRVWWVGELLSHPRPQYIIGLLIVIVINFLDKIRPPLTLRRFTMRLSHCTFLNLRKVLHTAVIGTKYLNELLLIAFMMVAIINIVILFNQPPLNPPQREGDQSADLTLTHFNIGLWTADRTDSYEWLRENGGDVVLLQEVTPTVVDELTVELPDYMLVIAEPLWTTHGSAALVHMDVQFEIDGNIIQLLPNGRPLIHLTLKRGDHTINLLSLHTTRPQSAQTSAYQADEFAAVSEWSSVQNNVILIGDFNTTPWSHRFGRLLETGNLHAPRTQPFRTSTWPSTLPIPFRIPIDQIVTSETIEVVSRGVGAHLGSDHRPLHVHLNTGLNPLRIDLPDSDTDLRYNSHKLRKK